MKKSKERIMISDKASQSTKREKLKRVYKQLKAFAYKTRLSLLDVTPFEKRKYNVAICAIFKNEAPYLREWIEFNRIIGIEHFYLYNNNSEDMYLSVIQKYIDSGLVTLIQWSKNHAQMECYNDCINRYKHETQWLGFIDIDEFIVPLECDNIYDFLKKFEKNRGSVKIYWKMFGTSGLIERDLNSLVTEQFVVSWPLYYSVGKCFYNTSFDFDFQDEKNKNLHHLLWTNYKGLCIPPVNAFDKVCLPGFDIVKEGTHPIQINHYFTKSYKEYAAKKEKGDVYFKVNPHDKEYFYQHEVENTSVDYSAYKYLVKLKLTMSKEETVEKDFLL